MDRQLAGKSVARGGPAFGGKTGLVAETGVDRVDCRKAGGGAAEQAKIAGIKALSDRVTYEVSRPVV